MILVDTNIIIDFWKTSSDEYTNVFLDNDVAVCPIIEVELVAGAKSEKEKTKIREALKELRMLSIDESTWELLGEMLYKLRRTGVTVPLQDALIAAVAIRYDCLLWSNDKHFPLITAVITELKQFTLP